MKNLKCPHCQSQNKKKFGTMKTKRGKTARYKCKDCSKTFTKRTGTINYRKRKQHLRDDITKKYCERMSLRGIARISNASYPTVVKYFRENAQLAKQANKKRLAKKEIVTSYVQFDQLETYEHTKKKPVGIQISIRHKTGEIISAKAGYIPIRALSISRAYSEAWNEKARYSTHIIKMLNETREALNRNSATVTCDQDRGQVNTLKELYKDPFITLAPSSQENKKIDRVFRRMRQDISRLGRKTLSTTKKIKQLQNHLDLYIQYNNITRAA